MNKTLGALVVADLQKIGTQGKYKIYLALIVLIIVGMAGLNRSPGNLFGTTMAHYPYTMMYLLSYFFVPLAVFMLASDLLAGEIDTQEIKLWLTRPVLRSQLFVAKLIAVISYVIIILGVGLLLSGLLSAYFIGGFAFSWLDALTAYTVTLIALLAVIALAIMIATLAKSGTACFFLCLLAYIGCLALGLFFPHLSPVLFTTYLGMGNMVIGSSIPLINLSLGLLISLGYGLGFLSIGALVFAGRDF